MILISALELFNIEDAFILFLSELKDALCCDSASTSFAVKSMSRQRMAELSQGMVMSVPWMSSQGI